MKKKFTLISLTIFISFMFTASNYAGTIKIKQISLKQHRALLTITPNEDLEDFNIKGDLLIVTIDDETICKIKTTKIKNNKIYADTSFCIHEKLLKKDQLVELSLNENNNSGDNQNSDNNTSSDKYPTKNEDWYTYWSLGVSSISYEKLLKANTDSLDRVPGIVHTSIALDLFGFYYPNHQNKLLLGFIIHSIADSYTVDSTNEEISITQFFYNFSSIKFFGKNIGDGLFIRGDIGLTNCSINFDTNLYPNTTFESSTSWGLLIGMGYAIPIGVETRMMFNLNFSLHQIKFSNMEDSESISNTNLTLGFLF